MSDHPAIAYSMVNAESLRPMSAPGHTEFPRQQYWNRNGDPLSGGQVWYDGPVYMNADHTIPHPTPIILDANGCCVVYPDGRLPVKVTDWNGIPQRV